MPGKLLRLFSYVFSSGLCLAMIGVSLVVLLSGSDNFTLEMIPWWTGRALAKWLLGTGAAGLLFVAWAATGRIRFLLMLWTLAVVGALVYGLYVSNYKFEDWDHFRSSLNLTGAALVSFFGALTGLWARSGRHRER